MAEKIMNRLKKDNTENNHSTFEDDQTLVRHSQDCQNIGKKKKLVILSGKRGQTKADLLTRNYFIFCGGATRYA